MNTITSQLAGDAQLQQFFEEISSYIAIAEKNQRQRDLESATRFNVFTLIDPDENKLSEVLAFLLNPQGNHGQGKIFLQLFFRQLGLDLDAKRLQAGTVRREVYTHAGRRMDVLVDVGILVAIENKVDAMEQEGQIKDYLDDLSLRTKGDKEKSILIYLTPNGRLPKSIKSDARLVCWSYQVELRKWVAACRQQCVAPKTQDFLCDFNAYIESHLKREPETNNEKETDEH